MENKTRDKAKQKPIFIVIYSFIAFLFASSILLAIVIFTENIKTNEIKISNTENEQVILDIEKKVLSAELSNLISDLLVMKDTVKTSNKNNIRVENNATLISYWESIMNNSKNYDQLRFIDKNGYEKLRLSNKNGEAKFSNSAELQYKGDRYYFVDTMKLNESEVYISKLDLNKEYGEIEKPIKPMIRLACKVYDKNQKTLGIVILNYYAEHLIKSFDHIARGANGIFYLLNANGYWIRNFENPKTEWAFMYEDKKHMSFKNKKPEIWEDIILDKSRVYKDDKNVYFVSKIIPFDEKDSDSLAVPLENIILGEGNWYVISHIKKSHIREMFPYSFGERLLSAVKNSVIALFSIAIISIVFGNLFYRSMLQGEKIKFYSEFDQMTKAYNRRAGMDRLTNLVKRTRNEIDIAIMFLDIDSLKEVNDKLGHKKGDSLIKIVSNTISSLIRSSDFLFRYGGDEFILVLSKTNKNNSKIVWERIRQKIDAVNNEAEHEFVVSVSHGVSEILASEENVDIKSKINQADEQMYFEKKQKKLLKS